MCDPPPQLNIRTGWKEGEGREVEGRGEGRGEGVITAVLHANSKSSRPG